MDWHVSIERCEALLCGTESDFSHILISDANMYLIAPLSEGAYLKMRYMKTIFQRDAGSFFIQPQIFPFTSPNKQRRAAQRHLFLHLLFSAPCQKRQMTWILPFKNAVQYLGLGFDSMEEELLSHCRVKLERAVWISVMCTFNEAH